MRIAFLTSEFGDLGEERGGLGYHLSRTVPSLVGNGHRCDVFLCSGVPADDCRDELDYQGALVHKLSSAGKSPFDDLRLPAQVRHHLRSAYLLAQALGEVSRRTPFDVVQVPNFGISGLFVDVATPIVMRFSSHAPTWHSTLGAARDSRVILGELLQRRAIDRAEMHFAPSRFVAALAEAELGLPVEVVRPPMPVEIDRSRWDFGWARGVAGSAPYLLHAGQLGRPKGSDLVLAATEECFRATPDVELHLCGRDAGAGEGIEQLRKRVPGRVHYHGRVAPAQLLPLMEGALAVVCPSRADNLPNVVIEAMSAGVPVVGVRAASIDELVEDGSSGFLADPEDADSLAAALQRVVSLPAAERLAMGARARERVLELLDEQASVRSLVEVYARAADAQLRPRRPQRHLAMQLRSDLIAIGQLKRKSTSPFRTVGRVISLLANRLGRR